ncbi:MAG: FAD:protein FMN transferase [Eubacteriales bacterium]|nr:FAD:protein FMN transferase [Eubacteriales bacterium]
MMKNNTHLSFSARLSVIIVVLTALVLTSCTSSQASTSSSGSVAPESQTTSPASLDAPVKYSSSFTSSFDTVITLIGYANDQAEFDHWADLAESEFQKLHQLFDIYHEYPGINNLMSVNRQAGKGPVRVDTQILDLIEFYLVNDQLAPGLVSPSLGSVLSVWHDHREAAESGQATVPNPVDLQAAAEHIDPASLKIDRQASTLELTDPLVRLDVGAVAKGYATEIVAQLLKEQGMTSGIISAGGSNVRLIGKPADPARETWAIGIQNPFVSMLIPEGQSVDVILANETSIVTSGDYQRYYLVDGAIYHHLIDPKTLMPANHQRAVTIVTPDSGLADYLSTAVFLMPYEDGRQLVESLPDCEALWIFQDGSMQATDGLLARLKDKANGNAKDMAEALAK